MTGRDPRGPRWAQTSMASLGLTGLGGRYLCPLTAHAWRSVQMARALTSDTLGCMTGLDPRGQRWVLTYTVKLSMTNLVSQYLCPQTVRGLRLGHLITMGMTLIPDTLGCMTGLDPRGQSWVLTSMARVILTILVTRYLCPQTVRGLRSAHIVTMGMALIPDTLGCMTGLDPRGQSWVLT